MMSGKLELYADVKSVLDRAIAAGGGRFVLSSPGQATRWRQRAYYFRQLERKYNRSTLYDSIFLRIEKGDPGAVLIELSTTQGVLEDREGRPLDAGQHMDKEPSLDDFTKALGKLG